MIFDEMRGAGKSKRVRAPYRHVAEWLDTKSPDDLARKCAEAEALFRRTGITFAVYGAGEASERLIPFDIIPRILSAAEWRQRSTPIMARRFAARDAAGRPKSSTWSSTSSSRRQSSSAALGRSVEMTKAVAIRLVRCKNGAVRAVSG